MTLAAFEALIFFHFLYILSFVSVASFAAAAAGNEAVMLFWKPVTL